MKQATEIEGQHVVPTKEGGWSVRRTGAPRATRVFDQRTKAIAFARDLAKKQQGTLYIHSKDGTVQGRDSYRTELHAKAVRD